MLNKLANLPARLFGSTAHAQESRDGFINLPAPFHHDEGYCWVANLPHEEQYIGDTGDRPNQSSLILLENEKELGPPHSAHQEVRQAGGGHFSHWNHQVFFSTSDNSNPNSNGRQYRVTLRKIDQETITQIGIDESLLLSAISENVNQNDRALHNILHCYRTINRLLGRVGESVRGKVVLEMGSSREPGLPLILLLTGAARYYANNIFPVNDWVSESYAKLTYLMLSGLLPYDPPPLHEVCEAGLSPTGERIVRLRPEKFVSVSPVPAEEIDLPENSVDLIFSISVLEHVTKPREMIQNMFRMLKPGGLAVHGIDLRDHNNFSRPLDFLMYSPEDYVQKTPATENRWRALDFLECFTGEGFETLEHLFRDIIPAVTSRGTTDICELIMRPFDEMYKSSFDSIAPSVTSEMRAKFDSAYQAKSLAELSVLAMSVIMRKPLEEKGRP